MSLYGALFGGVSGLRAQSSKIGVISDNIANSNTIGYKEGTTSFQTLVVNSGSAGSYSTGGVRTSTLMSISKQGLLQSTESSTDIAISGGGFFVVKASPEFSTLATPYYTRAGSFTQDSLGNFINPQGYYLQGWPLDREGQLPGQGTNLNTTSFTDLTSLRTVNVESASGSAQATSSIQIGANLKAGETTYPGQDGVFSLDGNNIGNLNQPADAIIVGAEYGGFNGSADADSVRRGDRFTLTTGTALSYTYEYGGYSVGRNVTTAVNNEGDSNINNRALVNLSTTGDIAYGPTNTTFDVTIPNHGLISGDEISLSGFGGAVGTTPASELNATHVITYVDADTVRITVTTGHGAGAITAGDTFTANKYASLFSGGNVLDATDANANFLALTGSTSFTGDALTFSISNPSAGDVTFRYTSASPNAANGEFNSLSTLADAIDSVTGLTARVAGGRLVVGAEDANEAITFSNGDAVGSSTKRGIDWIGELGVTDVESSDHRFNSVQSLADIVNADDGVSASIDNPLSSPTLHLRVDDPRTTITFTDLAPPTTIPSGNDVSAPVGTYVGTHSSPVNIPVSIEITGLSVTDYVAGEDVYLANIDLTGSELPGNAPNGGPYQIVSYDGTTLVVNIPAYETVDITSAAAITTNAAAQISLAGTTNHGSLLAHLGLENADPSTPVSSLNGAAYTVAQTSSALGPQYSSLGGVNGQNMASGDITAQFSRNVRIYDSLGSGHDVRMSFIKIATNEWAVEVHSIPDTDITTDAGLVDGQIAVGTIAFNGDGTLRSVSAGLTGEKSIIWRNGASSSSVTLDFGTAGQQFGTVGASVIGLADGLSQFDSGYNVNFATQNGAPVGQLVSVSIDPDGFVIASYSNGETASLYKLPLADFANPDGLQAITGNVFAQTRDSGEQNLREAGTNGTGSVVGAALEQSNVDLAEQLTDMIVAQRSYQANTKVIKTADELLEQLNQI